MLNLHCFQAEEILKYWIKTTLSFKYTDNVMILVPFTYLVYVFSEKALNMP